MEKLFFSLLLAFFAVVPLYAEKIYAVPVLEKVAVKLDGVPDESFWQDVPVIDDFRCYGKKESKAAAATSVRICLDHSKLYISLICDEPEKVFTGTPGTGSAWSADCAEIFLGSLDGRDWFRQIVFGLNGAEYYECIRAQDVRKAVRINERSWSAELIIPREKLGNIIDNEIRFNMFRSRFGKEMQTIADLRWALEMEKYVTLKLYTPAETILYGPWNTQITGSSAVICWESIGKCMTSLRFRKKGTEKWTMVFADICDYVADRSQKLHTVKLRDLEPGTVYEYLINEGTVGTFTTLDPAEADFSFAAIADTHGRSWQLARELQRKHIQAADIFFHLGDTVSGIIGRGSFYDVFIAPMHKNWQKPFYVARGNHEGRGNAPGVFMDMVYPDGRKAYNGFLHKGVYFIILDASDDFNCDPEFWEEQKRWLNDVIKSAEFKNASFRVLISHYPLFLRNERTIRELFESMPADVQNSFDLALAGHYHCRIKIMPGENMITSDHVKYNKTAAKKALPFLRMVNFGGTFNVQKTADRLTVTSYDADGKVIDTMIVPRKK